MGPKPSDFWRMAVASTAATLTPQHVWAAENSPQVVVFSSLAMVLLVAAILIYQWAAVKGAHDSENHMTADQGSILYKLNHYLNPAALYRIEVYRQSGNTERVEGPISGQLVAEKVLASMRRASITAVSISKRSGGIDVRRLIYNGRGRQEGKRIGGYFITLVLTPTNDVGAKQSINAKPTEQISSPIQVSVKSEAEAALIKSWYRIDNQIASSDMQSVRAFMSGFDRVSGKGEGSISHVDFFLFLSFVDRYLCGEAPITPEIRDQLGKSDAAHHQKIFRQNKRVKIRGIESFDAKPEAIKEAFTIWFNLLGFADVVKENRPSILTLDLEYL